MEIATTLANHNRKPILAERMHVLMEGKWKEEDASIDIHQLLRENNREKILANRHQITLAMEQNMHLDGDEMGSENAATKIVSAQKTPNRKRLKGRWAEEEDDPHSMIINQQVGEDDDGEAEIEFKSKKLKQLDTRSSSHENTNPNYGPGEDPISALLKNAREKAKEKEKAKSRDKEKEKEKDKDKTKEKEKDIKLELKDHHDSSSTSAAVSKVLNPFARTFV
jgi:hypothetical protein